MRLSKTFRQVALGSMISATAVAVSQQALAAFTSFIAVKGARQGQFKSEAIQDKHKDKWMPVVSFSFGLQAPRDPASGMASGKRRYDPVCVVKEWGAATSQFFTAAATNEVLTEVDFEFDRTNVQGVESVFQTIKLENAQVSKISQFTGHPGDTAAAKHTPGADANALEEVCFTFQRITMNNVDAGKTTAFTDNWQAVQ